MFFHRGGKRNKFGWFTLEVSAKHCGIAQSLVGGFPRGLMRQPPPAAFYKAGREPQVLPGSLALQLEITFRARGGVQKPGSRFLHLLSVSVSGDAAWAP